MPVRDAGRAAATGDGEGRRRSWTQLASVFVVVWVFGVAVAALAMSLGVASLWQLRRQSKRLTHGPLADMLRQLRNQLGIQRKVELYKTARRAIPLTWETLRPRIVLPNAADYWDKQHRWITTGYDTEYEIESWLPAHVQLLLGTALFSFTSFGAVV